MLVVYDIFGVDVSEKRVLLTGDVIDDNLSTITECVDADLDKFALMVEV